MLFLSITSLVYTKKRVSDNYHQPFLNIISKNLIKL